jgi:hypothetical protein
MTHLIIEGLREVAFARGIFHQDHFSSANHAGFPVTDGSLHTIVEINNVLPPRGRMPVQGMGRRSFAKYQACYGETLGEASTSEGFHVFHVDICKMRFTLRIRVALQRHLSALPKFAPAKWRLYRGQ